MNPRSNNNSNNSGNWNSSSQSGSWNSQGNSGWGSSSGTGNNGNAWGSSTNSGNSWGTSANGNSSNSWGNATGNSSSGWGDTGTNSSNSSSGWSDTGSNSNDSSVGTGNSWGSGDVYVPPTKSNLGMTPQALKVLALVACIFSVLVIGGVFLFFLVKYRATLDIRIIAFIISLILGSIFSVGLTFFLAIAGRIIGIKPSPKILLPLMFGLIVLIVSVFAMTKTLLYIMLALVLFTVICVLLVSLVKE